MDVLVLFDCILILCLFWGGLGDLVTGLGLFFFFFFGNVRWECQGGIIELMFLQCLS